MYEKIIAALDSLPVGLTILVIAMAGVFKFIHATPVKKSEGEHFDY